MTDILSLPYDATTDELAALNGVQPASIRRALSMRGSYHGLRPRKMRSGRLMWQRVMLTADGPIVPRDEAVTA